MKHTRLALLPLVLALGCASWWQRTPEHATDVAKILSCVLDKRAQGLDPIAIATSCGLENAQSVIDLLRVADAPRPATKAPSSAAPSTSTSGK